MTSSQWTNKYAIMRDLSLAQGCVPIDIQGTIGAEDKPPVLDIVEETEEPFFQNLVAEGDFAAPDLGLIKAMLDMVRGTDELSIIKEKESSKTIQINKLNPSVTGFVPTHSKASKQEIQKENILLAAGDNNRSKTPDIAPENKTPVEKKKSKRNVAMASFLEALGVDKTKLPDKEDNKMLLLKPNNFLLTTENLNTKEQLNTKDDQPSASFDKVNSWLKAEVPKRELILVKPKAMFKRRSPASPESTTSIETSKSSEQTVQIAKYKPSKWAEKYERTYTERGNMHVILTEDVWARAERQMKEIDNKRKLELLMFEESCRNSTNSLATEQTEEQSTSDF